MRLSFTSALVLRREIGEENEYVLVMLRDPVDSVRGFSGPDPVRAVYYPEDSRYFLEEQFTPFARHFDMLAV